MKRGRFFLALAVLSVALFATVGPSPRPAPGQDKAARPVARWEYKVVDTTGPARDTEAALNKLGEEGWECVSAVSLVTGGGETPIRTSVRLVCKRPKH